MTTQQMLMYGLRRSPILAHFQKTPVILHGTKLEKVHHWVRLRSQSDGFYLPRLIPVQNTRCKVVHVCARADEEEDDEEQRLKVEEGRLERAALLARVSENRRVSWRMPYHLERLPRARKRGKMCCCVDVAQRRVCKSQAFGRAGHLYKLRSSTGAAAQRGDQRFAGARPTSDCLAPLASVTACTPSLSINSFLEEVDSCSTTSSHGTASFIYSRAIVYELLLS